VRWKRVAVHECDDRNSRVSFPSLMTGAHSLELANGVCHALLLRGGGIRVMVDDALPAEENRVVVGLAWSLRDLDVVDIMVLLRQRVPGLWVPRCLLRQDHTSLAQGIRVPENRGLSREGLVRWTKAARDIGRGGHSEARGGFHEAGQEASADERKRYAVFFW
jgi:hypothetical protein